MPKRGEWVMCTSCGEESLWRWKDQLDFVCSVCGGHSYLENEYTLNYNKTRSCDNGPTNYKFARTTSSNW